MALLGGILMEAHQHVGKNSSEDEVKTGLLTKCFPETDVKTQDVFKLTFLVVSDFCSDSI